MRRRAFVRSLLALACAMPAGLAAPALAADAKPPADPSKPATTVRVGGSPADAEFRDATEKAQAHYREAKAACKSRPSAERKTCLRDAKSELKSAQDAAKAAHDAANKR
jgi:hypothetical protein